MLKKRVILVSFSSFAQHDHHDAESVCFNKILLNAMFMTEFIKDVSEAGMSFTCHMPFVQCTLCVQHTHSDFTFTGPESLPSGDELHNCKGICSPLIVKSALLAAVPRTPLLSAAHN